MPETAPIAIPDDVTVWAATDIHGQLRATRAVLAEAGLVDAGGHWIAPPRTAFVVCGDIVDRGPASLQLLRWLVALGEEAAARDGLVVLLEGNHEIQALLSLEGDPVVAEAWMLFGAGALLESAGMTAAEFGPDVEPVEVARRLAAVAPDLEGLLRGLVPYATWRDVLFVHGGPTPGTRSLADYAASVERLWIRDAFYAAAEPFPAAPPWRVYAAAGIGRVVFGHTSLEAPATFHDDRAINIDTARGGRVTLARIPEAGPLAEARILSAQAEPRRVGDPPYTMDDVRAWDSRLPPHIDARRAREARAASR
jgi:hypothetical protein